MNIIVLSKNFENYIGGYYHYDMILAYKANHNCYLYGENYPNYDENDNIDDVIAKSPFDKQSLDLVVVNTSWEFQKQNTKRSDPHPNINLSELTVPKIFYLNKEYANIDCKLEYAKKNKFDLVLTMYPNHAEWSEQTGLRVRKMDLGVNLDRFNQSNNEKVYDFGFTGSAQKHFQDIRFRIKNILMKDVNISSNVSWHGALDMTKYHDEFQRYQMIWTEWGSSNRFTRLIWPFRNKWARWELDEMLKGRLLPSRQEYPTFLSMFKVFLSTMSHEVILSPRYYQCMANKTVLLIPKSEHYGDYFTDQDNCIMFNPDLSDFKEKLHFILDNEDIRNKISEKAYEDVNARHTYKHRVARALEILDLQS